MDLKLDDKIAIVTGGGKGIGSAIAKRLAVEGACVVAADIDMAAAEKVVDEIKADGGKAKAIALDATDEKSVNEMIKTCLDEFGRIDIVVNNVGGGEGSSFVVDYPVESWDKTVNMNMRSTFLCSQAAARDMIPRREGRIINIASIAGKNGEPLLGAYCSSKFGVIGLTQSMARELGRFSITVNAICPGYVWTPAWETLATGLKEKFEALKDKTPEEIFKARVKSVTPLGRPQTGEDIASMVAYLASHEAKNITGQAINIDGGVTTH